MRLTLELVLEKCSACGACAIACMDQNDTQTGCGAAPFRAVFDLERDGRFAWMSLSCMHCEDAPCVMGCPTGCLRKDTGTNLTVYDTTYCIGCHSCAMACPFGVPSFSADGKLAKCDGCITRLEHGLQPACVLVCPTGALTLQDVDTAPHHGETLRQFTEIILAN